MKHSFSIAIALVVLFSSCKKDDDNNNNNNNNNNLDYALGWFGSDNTGTIPVSVNSSTFFSTGQTPPTSFNLVPKFPPIGDQGQYGTCVAWAVGYNYKTALEGADKGWDAAQLAQTNNQLSPKDLFTAIDDSKKGADCNGTNFTDALDLVLQRGIATMQTVPYTNLGGCQKSTLDAAWTAEAAGHKIGNYRKIDVNANTIKSYVSNNTAVIFGCKLGDNFMTWNSDEVITGHSGFDNTGIHAYHAMVIAGYDDSKGPNGAFRVINSWGPNWGDAGYIWVDYNFFVNGDFCFGGNCYVASNGQSDNNPPDVNPTIDGSVDLATWAFFDYSTYDTTGYTNSRRIEYNVYNIGDQTASSSSGWSLYYLYYNAYDASDYGFLFYDEFNTSISAGTYDCPTSDHCIVNYDIASGGDLGGLFATASIYQDYYVPGSLTGYYYLLLFADAWDVIGETDEQNNYFYTTSQYPVYFDQGYADKRDNGKPAAALSDYKFANQGSKPSKSEIQGSRFHSAVSKDYPNAYSVQEIKEMLKQEKMSGKFQSRLERFKAQKNMSGSMGGK